MLTSSFLRRVVRRARSELGYPPRLIATKIAGREVIVREGLVHAKPDKDDAWMAALILDSTVLVDVGCNVGLWSLYAGLTDATRVVVAWDANPAALAQCAENLLCNGISHRARFVLAFASESKGSDVEFFTVGTGAAGSRYPGHARTASRRGNHFSVPTQSIDQVVRELQLQPDLVKVDVEGAEGEALVGASALAREGKARFIVEMHSPPELPMVENCRRVLAWCHDVGYKAYYLKEHSQISTPEPIAHRGRCHLLLIPAQAEYPLWLRAIQENSSVEQGMAAF